MSAAVIALAVSSSASQGGVVSERAPSGHSAQAGQTVRATARSETACANARRAVRFYSARIRESAAKMGAAAELVSGKRTGCPRYLARVLQRKARAWRLRAERWFERTYAKFRCIHEREGAWDDPNPPHYGGLQFDDAFQRTYGPEFFRRWGDAGNWPVWAQLVAAERAYRVRGFTPWPSTARACGFL